MRWQGNLVALLLFLPAMACATMTNGPLQRIEVTSAPSGASVQFSECGAMTRTGATPFVTLVSRRATRCTIALSKPGYEPTSVRLRRMPSPRVPFDYEPVNDSLSAFLVEMAMLAAVLGTSELVDFGTGARYMQVPAFLQIQLERLPLSDESWRDPERPNEAEPEPEAETEPETEPEQ